MIWHHRLNHCSFKYFLRFSNRGIIPRNISKVRKKNLCVAFLFGKYHKRPWRTKGKRSCGSIRKPSDTRLRDMTYTDQMVYAQSGIIIKVTGDLTHTRF